MHMNSLFMESLDLREHPIKKAKKKLRTEYFSALTYIINEVVSQTEDRRYISERLKMYYTALFSDVDTEVSNQNAGIGAVDFCVSRPWRKKYRFLLVCDISLILFDEILIRQAIKIINSRLSNRGQTEVGRILVLLLEEKEIDKKYNVIASQVKQYRLNKLFLSQEVRRIIVTANMSAGKSTLINALIGKPLARTSQEVCTGNVCYLFNKAFEDNNVHLATETLTLSASDSDLHSYEWTGPISIASYFAPSTPEIPRLCIIDTPGVDAALYKEHTILTHLALQKDDYDIVVYVVCPTNLGTDAEINHLKWVAQNIPKEKIVFVLNKLDNFRDCSDSVEESVQGLKADLLKLGFEDPVICPISAYFSYLIKLKMTGQTLSDDEADEYTYLSKKFLRSAYDLSRFYSSCQLSEDETEVIQLSKRAGLYGFEKMIYGG